MPKLILILLALFEGCYPDSFESLQYVVEKTMTLSSVGMCQEICRHENIGQFAVKVGVHFAQYTIVQLRSVFCCYQI